jgi:hypothetical protein
MFVAVARQTTVTVRRRFYIPPSLHPTHDVTHIELYLPTSKSRAKPTHSERKTRRMRIHSIILTLGIGTTHRNIKFYLSPIPPLQKKKKKEEKRKEKARVIPPPTPFHHAPTNLEIYTPCLYG